MRISYRARLVGESTIREETMRLQELSTKLRQIEEHAELTLEEFPTLTKERQRMIISLCRYLRTELGISGQQAANDSERPGAGLAAAYKLK
jgi:hypothetical protein